MKNTDGLLPCPCDVESDADDAQRPSGGIEPLRQRFVRYCMGLSDAGFRVGSPPGGRKKRDGYPPQTTREDQIAPARAGAFFICALYVTPLLEGFPLLR